MKQTDWDDYYKKPYKFAGFTKGFIIRRLHKYIKKHAPAKAGFTMLEFGGGNSCFYELFDQAFKPEKYYIADNNQVGLDAFGKRIGKRDNTILLNCDVLDVSLDNKCDIVFSIGLIEHFSVEDTRKSILSHFQVLKDGGILILGFPTPTFLYRISRKISEWLNMWIFHDERPLEIPEVMTTASEQGVLLESTIIWPIFFTQALLVIRKNS